MPRRRCCAICLAGALAIVTVFTAHADSTAPGGSVSTPGGGAAVPASSQASPEKPTGTAPPTPSAGVAASPFGFLTAAASSPNLLGDMWGLRPLLAKYGMTLSIVENSEVFGNVTGGVRQGFEYNGLTTATLQMDTQRAFGWDGGLFNASALQIHGGNLSATNLDTLQTASGIEADRATRLWELWHQQKFGDKFDVKVGQQSLDQEFMVSANANYFINTAFGWAILPTEDLPGGGPAYPLSALGIRARSHVNDNITVLAGVFNGSPVYDNTGDPQKQNPSGVSFPTNGGVLAIAELQFQSPGSGAQEKANTEDPLVGTYKIGFWYDSESFADLRYDTAGLPLGNPANNQTPASRRGNYAFYAVADQMIWRGADADRNINVFVRPMFTPLEDRNLISFELNAGLTMRDPLQGRKDDTAGLAMGVVRVSNSATGFNQDTAFYNPGVFTAIRTNETFLEATYQYQVMPWWQIQPDFQYVFNPGGGIVNPNNPTQEIKNELVIGLRTNITF
jgi:porin